MHGLVKDGLEIVNQLATGFSRKVKSI